VQGQERKIGFMGEPHFFEVCINVEDLDRSLEQFKSLFDMVPYYVRETEIGGFSLHGRKVDKATIRFAYFHAGPMRLELLQPVQGDSIWAEYVRRNGTGIQHIGCLVSDLDAEIAVLKKRGVEITQYWDFPKVGNKIAYLDTEGLLGTSLELIEYRDPPEAFQYPQRDWELRFLEVPHFFEFCVVVEDMQRSLERMRTLFDMTPYLTRETKMPSLLLHGEKVPPPTIVYSYFRAGPMRFELLQPLEGRSIYREFLDRKGTCVQHIGCRTAKLDSELAHLEKKGVGATQIMDVPAAEIKIVNTDTERIAGVEFELIQSPGIPGE